MLNTNEIKKLDDYQLFQLIQNTLLDKDLSRKLQVEFDSRNVAPENYTRLKQKHSIETNEMTNSVSSVGNPIFTAFLLKKHFAYLAVLQTQGKKQEAQNYTWRLILGLAIYFAGLSMVLMLYLMIN